MNAIICNWQNIHHISIFQQTDCETQSDWCWEILNTFVRTDFRLSYQLLNAPPVARSKFRLSRKFLCLRFYPEDTSGTAGCVINLPITRRWNYVAIPPQQSPHGCYLRYRFSHRRGAAATIKGDTKHHIMCLSWSNKEESRDTIQSGVVFQSPWWQTMRRQWTSTATLGGWETCHSAWQLW